MAAHEHTTIPADLAEAVSESEAYQLENLFAVISRLADATDEINYASIKDEICTVAEIGKQQASALGEALEDLGGRLKKPQADGGQS